MNLDKLTVLLCLAFQESEGPFDVNVKMSSSVSRMRLMKNEIKELSMSPSVVEIDIGVPIADRRSKERWTKNRRINRRTMGL